MTDIDKFSKKLDSVINQITNAKFMFDRQRNGLINTLQSLEVQALEIGNDSIELGKLNFYIGILMSENTFEQEESLQRIIQALATNENNSFLTTSELLTANSLLVGLSIELGADENAKKYLRKLQDHLNNSSIDDEERLEMIDQTAYYYHELGMYNEALISNLATLEHSKNKYGPQDPRLLTVTRNISENLYCLKRLEEAIRYQSEVVELAKHNDEVDIEVESLFKIGVLNHESGNNKKAKEYFYLSLAAANRSGDESLISYAKSNLEELDRKLKKWWKFW